MDTTGKSILIIDDSESFIRSLKRALPTNVIALQDCSDFTGERISFRTVMDYFKRNNTVADGNFTLQVAGESLHVDVILININLGAGERRCRKGIKLALYLRCWLKALVPIVLISFESESDLHKACGVSLLYDKAHHGYLQAPFLVSQLTTVMNGVTGTSEDEIVQSDYFKWFLKCQLDNLKHKTNQPNFFNSFIMDLQHCRRVTKAMKPLSYIQKEIAQAVSCWWNVIFDHLGFISQFQSLPDINHIADMLAKLQATPDVSQFPSQINRVISCVETMKGVLDKFS